MGKEMKNLFGRAWLLAFLLAFLAGSGVSAESGRLSNGDDEGGRQEFGQDQNQPTDQPPVSIRLGEPEPESRPPRPARYSGWGGLMTGYLILDLSALDPMIRDRGLPGFDEQLVMIGGLGGVAYYPPGDAGWWLFGGMGFGINLSESARVGGETRKAKMEFNGGGLFVEYHYSPSSRLDLALGSMVGGGSLALRAEGEDLGLINDDHWSANASFLLIYPYAGIGYQVMPWMRIEMTVGFLFMNADLSGADFTIDDSNLEMTDGNLAGGPQYMLRLIFGWRQEKKR